MTEGDLREALLIEAIRALDEDEDAPELPEYWSYYLAQTGADWKGIFARAVIEMYDRAQAVASLNRRKPG